MARSSPRSTPLDSPKIADTPHTPAFETPLPGSLDRVPPLSEPPQNFTQPGKVDPKIFSDTLGKFTDQLARDDLSASRTVPFVPATARAQDNLAARVDALEAKLGTLIALLKERGPQIAEPLLHPEDFA